MDILHSGSCCARPTSAGWLVELDDSTSLRLHGHYLVPLSALQSSDQIGNDLIAVMRQSIVSQERFRPIPKGEARKLVRWSTPRVWRGRGHHQMLQHVFYNAELSRRGWVVTLYSTSRRLPGRFILPIRARKPHGDRWYGGSIISAVRKWLTDQEGTRLITDEEAERLLGGGHK